MLYISPEMLLYAPVANARNLGGAGGLRVLCSQMQCSVVIFSLGRKFIVQRLQEPRAMHGTGRLAAQSKMNLCLLVFVLSVDTSAQHVNCVMLPTCLYPVCRPVPAEKGVKIYGVERNRQR